MEKFDCNKLLLVLVLLEFRAFQALLFLHDPLLGSPLSLPITALTLTLSLDTIIANYCF